MPPVAVDRAHRLAEDAGRLLHAQPGEVAEHDDLRQVRLLGLELLDRLVQRQQVVGRRLDEGHPFGQLDAPALAAVLVTGLAARLLDEDLAHGPRRGAEEVAPALPAGILVADQPQVGLVDQGGRLERLPGRSRCVSAAARRRSSS